MFGKGGVAGLMKQAQQMQENMRQFRFCPLKKLLRAKQKKAVRFSSAYAKRR